MRRVAILYPSSVPWMARCFSGIRHYAQNQGNWHLFSSPPTLRGAEESALTLGSMRGWKGDAIIAATHDRAELRIAQKMQIPVVNLAAGLGSSYGVPRVMVNHFEAGRMAADHLLNRGLRDLAFFGWKDLWYSEQREAGFTERATEAGANYNIFLQSAYEKANLTWQQRIARLAKWLRTLARPSGVFAVTDYRAQFLMEACQEVGLQIPNDIAVIGMDNDETICEHSFPTLTSVSRNSEQVGWHAAALIDQMIHGEPVPTADVLLTPDGVIARQSTDRLFCTDPIAQHALDYMRANLKTQFNVDQLAQELGMSKRTLEMRFRQSLQASPHSFLTKLRVQHAQTLMQMHPRLSMDKLATECGFGSARALYKVFRRNIGESPINFRKNREQIPR